MIEHQPMKFTSKDYWANSLFKAGDCKTTAFSLILANEQRLSCFAIVASSIFQLRNSMFIHSAQTQPQETR